MRTLSWGPSHGLSGYFVCLLGGPSWGSNAQVSEVAGGRKAYASQDPAKLCEFRSISRGTSLPPEHIALPRRYLELRPFGRKRTELGGPLSHRSTARHDLELIGIVARARPFPRVPRPVHRRIAPGIFLERR